MIATEAMHNSLRFWIGTQLTQKMINVKVYRKLMEHFKDYLDISIAELQSVHANIFYPKGHYVLNQIRADLTEKDPMLKRRVVMVSVSSGLESMMQILTLHEIPHMVFGLDMVSRFAGSQVYHPDTKFATKVTSNKFGKLKWNMKKVRKDKGHVLMLSDESIIDYFNSRQNKQFHVLIFNSYLPEGISIYNTSKSTLLTNYDDPKVTDQALGRVNRMCAALKGQNKQLTLLLGNNEVNVYKVFLAQRKLIKEASLEMQVTPDKMRTARSSALSNNSTISSDNKTKRI